MTLTLPVPPSPNRWPSNPFKRQAEKDRYRQRVWVRALQQGRPSRDPPQKVRVHARLYLCRLRDQDNAVASLKWTLDALRQKQRGAMRWRHGIADECGYFVDDDPQHLELTVEQIRVRRKTDERLGLKIEEADDD